MLLVIPSVEIKNGKCARLVKNVKGEVFTNDPIELAKLWRKENAKSLHVTDLDAVLLGVPVNFDVIRKMVQTVDIPIELGGGLRTYDNVRMALENGIFRAVIGSMFIENPDEAKKCLDKFGTSKVVLAIDEKNYRTIYKGGIDSGLTPISVSLNAKELGFKRLIYTNIVDREETSKPDVEAIKLIAANSKMRITVSGGISGLEDLLELQKLEPLGIDSVIIGRALYDNKFSCQQIWRMCEAGNYPYTAKV
jgi:phosphoribosylformimino-5-aminoimidazole carboxamide ribotide isomerase